MARVISSHKHLKPYYEKYILFLMFTGALKPNNTNEYCARFKRRFKKKIHPRVIRRVVMDRRHELLALAKNGETANAVSPPRQKPRNNGVHFS